MYDHQTDVLGLVAGAAATDADIALGTAAVVAVAYAGLQPMLVKALTAQVVTTFDTADTILTVTRRPTPGSGTGAVEIGTLTIPNAAAAPNVYYKEFNPPVKVSPGEELVISTDGGTTAGTAILRVLTNPSWEHPSNNTKLIESA